MRASVAGESVIVWRCEDGHVHTELADCINDQNGWLFFTLAEPGPDDPAARLLPVQQVVRVDFPGPIVVTHDDEYVFTRDIGVLDQAEIEADRLEPAQFADLPGHWDHGAYNPERRGLYEGDGYDHPRGTK